MTMSTAFSSACVQRPDSPVQVGIHRRSHEPKVEKSNKLSDEPRPACEKAQLDARLFTSDQFFRFALSIFS